MTQNAASSFESLSNSLQKALFSSVIFSCLGGFSFLFFSTVEYLNIETGGVRETSSARILANLLSPFHRHPLNFIAEYVVFVSDSQLWHSHWAVEVETMELSRHRPQLSLQLNVHVTGHRPDLLAQSRKNTQTTPVSQQLGVVCYSERAS